MLISNCFFSFSFSVFPLLILNNIVFSVYMSFSLFVVIFLIQDLITPCQTPYVELSKLIRV